MKHALFMLSVLLALPLTARAQAQAPGRSGAQLYDQRCAHCHGKTGHGDGVYAPFLNPRPRDFTSGRFKFRSTDTGALPTDADISRSIAEGLHGTSMPSWTKFLSPDDVAALVAQVKSFSPRFAAEQPQAIMTGEELPETPENAKAGFGVYEKLRCAACHGTDGRGSGAIAHAMKDDWGYPTSATMLTEPWTFRGGSSVRDIFLRFRTGMNGTPMPSFLDSATEPELWQLAVYVKSLGRKPLWEMKGEEVAAFYGTQGQEAAQDPVRHGAYIATVSGCALCHSPFREDSTMIEKFKFAGGQKFEVVPYGTFVSYNLTSDKETGLAGWTDDQIKRFVTTGTRRDGTRMLPFPMPWANYANLKAGDLDALIAFLRSLPPVSNRIPAPRSRNIVSYLAGKFRMLILKRDPPIYSYPGNAGEGGQQ